MIHVTAFPKTLSRAIYQPIQSIQTKVEALAKKVFGYLVRILTFQLGVIHTPGAYWIIRLFQKWNSDPREKRPFDRQRLQSSKQLLQNFGCKEHTLVSKDAAANIHIMTCLSKDVFQAFKDKGAEPIEITYKNKPRKALLNPPPEVIQKFRLNMIPIEVERGKVCLGALLPEAPKTKTFPHILYFHSPGRSMAMDRVFLLLHLLAGYDVTVCDLRGTAESTGTPSEGGYYLDAEAVLDHVRESRPLNEIYVAGYCQGAAVAAHLKKKHHAEGLHYIASNPFTSYREVLENKGVLGKCAARFGLHAIKTPHLAHLEDDFDNVKKLSNLPVSAGKFIFIHTAGDSLMPRRTVHELCKAVDGAGPIHEILRSPLNKRENGHMKPPHEDEEVWHRYVQYVT